MDENIWVQYANSSSQSLPLAEIIVDSPYVSGKIVAAVSEKALYPVTLGLEYVRPVPKGMCDSGAKQSANSSNSEEKAVSLCQGEEAKEDYMANSLLGRCFEASCVRPYARECGKALRLRASHDTQVYKRRCCRGRGRRFLFPQSHRVCLVRENRCVDQRVVGRRCYGCGKTGHLAKGCTRFRGNHDGCDRDSHGFRQVGQGTKSYQGKAQTTQCWNCRELGYESCECPMAVNA